VRAGLSRRHTEQRAVRDRRLPEEGYPVGWEDKLMEYNQKFFVPPLGLQEIQLITKQSAKKNYRYKCKDAPLNSFCNAGLCRTRKHGIGGDGPDAPQMSSLVQIRKRAPALVLGH
jgi:hypothetical protein